MKVVDVIWNTIELSEEYAIHSKAKLNGSTNINSHKVKSALRKMKMEFGEMDMEAGFLEQPG